MCKLCNDTKRKNPTYIFCPYCGKSYNQSSFKPNYMEVKKCDGTTSFIKLSA